jgi:hypothetical protein
MLKQVIHRLSTEKIFRGLLMGFNMKRWEYEKSENDCTCQPAHAQIQPEKPRGVSGSNGKAQGQNLLCSRSDLSRPINNYVSTTQTSKLRSCVLGRDRRERYSLRLDRGSPREASFHQAGAQDGSPSWNGLVRRVLSLCHSLQFRHEKNYRNLVQDQVHPDLGIPSNIKTHKQQASSLKHKCTSFPTFGYRREGGPISHKLLDRGP